MIKKLSRKKLVHIRHKRLRKKVSGTLDVPRLSIYKSIKNLYIQIIDDVEGNTLFGVSTLSPDVKKALADDKQKRTEAAKKLGAYVGEKVVAKGIKKICFDRGGFPYHGIIKAFAEGAREAGLEF